MSFGGQDISTSLGEIDEWKNVQKNNKMNLYFKTNQEQILWISKIQFQKTIRNYLTVYVSSSPLERGEKEEGRKQKR